MAAHGSSATATPGKKAGSPGRSSVSHPAIRNAAANNHSRRLRPTAGRSRVNPLRNNLTLNLMRLIVSLMAGVLTLLAAPAIASAQQSPKISLVRDAETENTIRYFAAPLLKAAGLNPQSLRVHLVLDDRMNAFVAGGQRIFINTGLLRSAESPDAVIGVLAHETGHIAGGHLAKMQENLRSASAQSIIALVLGAAAAVATGEPEAAIAGATMGQSIGQRSFLRYTSANESAADLAALSYLDKTEQSARGLLEVLESLQDQELLSGQRQDPYLRTHPLSQERIATVRQHMSKSRYSERPTNPNLDLLHRRVRGKLNGYVDPPSRTLSRYAADDPDIEARYARIQAFIKLHRTTDALAIVDGLIESSPNDMFFHEVKGDILYRAGQIADSLPPYRRAIQLVEQSNGELPLIRLSLAQSLLQIPSRDTAAEALDQLKVVADYEPWTPRVWRLMATSYGRLDDFGGAAYALAEEAMLVGDRAGASRNVARALEQLPPDSPLRERALDIQNLLGEGGKGDGKG
ncbi:MAG: M48 family metalloprotease [Rhodospirillales bacterium]|nr:MAG: M48 family metalloprotease [Rhodospirillales bacterium]